MYFLELILAREVKYYAAGIALHGARSGLLEVDPSAEIGCAQHVFAGYKEKLSPIRMSVHLGRDLLVRWFLCCGDLVCSGFGGCLHGNGPRLQADIAGCDDILHMVFGAKIEGRLIGSHVAGFAVKTWLVEDDLPWFVGDDPMFRLDESRVGPRNLEMNLRRQRKFVTLSFVLN